MEKICKKVLHFKKRCVIIIHVAKICRCDGIGRRDRLKICWGDPCRFESGHRHQMESSFRTALFFFSNCLKWRSFAVFGSFYFCLENVRKRKNQSGCTPVAPEKIKNSGLMRFFGYGFRSPAP